MKHTFIVRGLVQFEKGVPAFNFFVVAFDRDIRSEEKLGESTTDRNGVYHIDYSEKKFRNLERGAADIVVRVIDSDGTVLTSSEVMYNAPREAEINLTIPAKKKLPPSLFERIDKDIKPLLKSVTLDELEEDENHQDVTFLTAETAFERRDVVRFILANYLCKKGLDKEFWFALLGGSFFEYEPATSLKANKANTISVLVTLDKRAVQKSLTKAFNKQEISTSLKEKKNKWIKEFQELIVRQTLGDKKSPTFAKQALEHAGIDSDDKQAKFARLFNKNKALTPDLLSAMQKDRAFKKAEIEDLRASYKLAQLTQADFSLVKMLKDEFDIRNTEQINTLARQSVKQWVDLIKRKHKAGIIKLPIDFGKANKKLRGPQEEVYAKLLERQFREAFPTASFQGALVRADENGGAHGIKQTKSLTKLLDRHPDFDLLHTSIDKFLDKKVKTELRAAVKDESFRQELKAVQRVFKLAPTFESTDILLADGLHSAQMIYRLGEREFIQRYADQPGLSSEGARQIWRRAADTHAAVLTVVGDLAEFDSGILPGVLKSSHPDLSTFPNWKNLFQSGDICHCEHCRSALSPAAYFTELLMFLKDRNSERPRPGGGYHSVKDILFDRRPDLGYLELNCENALTPLPYVDVVCEVLEDVIADGEGDVEITGLTVIPTVSTAAKTAVAAALTAVNIKVGTDFTLSQVDPADPSRWVVHGDDETYLLKKKTTANFFAELLPNTKTSKEELRAYPAYVNAVAYEKLKVEKYPMAIPLELFDEGDARRAEQRARSFSLPFDLFAEEVGAAFKKCNLQRWDLMRTFRGSAAPNNPTEGDIAAEYFRISCDAVASFDEKRLILEADITETGQKAVWGGSLSAVANVKIFLRYTGLEYNEMLTLLDLPFINPAADMFIQHQDASCDTELKTIQGLLPSQLDRFDRIHRFLRLWRKLHGWTMWELDLTISSVGGGALDEPFLVKLYYLDRLKNRLGRKTTMEQLCALFDDLNIRTHFTKPYVRRLDGIYQNLFLNKRLIQPTDSAFEIDPTTQDIKLAVDPTTGAPILDPVTGNQIPSKISEHHPAILAGLGIKESDLLLLKALKKYSDGSAYINDDLKLANLSFLWRQAWIAKCLKLKIKEWAVLLKLILKPRSQDLQHFTDPKTAWEFIENIDHLRSTSFSPDELNWLLAADRTAKAAEKETDVARFLTTLRNDLQEIQTEYNPGQYTFLTPPRDTESLTSLLRSILQTLNRDETETDNFIKTLQGPVQLEADVKGLGASFTFPTSVNGSPNYIPVSYERVFRFSGMMTPGQRDTILNDPSLSAVSSSPIYQQAIQDLFEHSAQAIVTGLSAGFSFPTAITDSIPIHDGYVLRFRGIMTSAQRSILKGGALPSSVTGNISYVYAIDELFQQSLDALDYYVMTEIETTLTGITLPADQPSIPIRFNPSSKKLVFIGLMTDAESTALRTAGNPTDVIDELFQLPRLAIKFYEPVFTAPLNALPPAIDFAAQLSEELARKISYDAEQKLLRFAGIMSSAEQSALKALVPPAEIAYHNAVNQLASDPQVISLPDERIWLTDNDMDPALPANNTLAKRLANTAIEGLQYLSNTLSASLIVQQSSAQLSLPEAVTRYLFTNYAFLPGSTPLDTLLTHLTDVFSSSSGAVDYAGHKTTFDCWHWASRVARILNKWKITRVDIERLTGLIAGCQILDFQMLPLDDTRTIASTDKFSRTYRLLHYRDSVPETGITLLEVLEKLDGGATASEFSRDVQLLNEAWRDADVEALTTSLDLAFPSDFLLAESWERIRRAFYYIENLNKSADTAKAFAAPSMTQDHARSLKEFLRSKFGTDTWLELSSDIQDALRERKRDALSAYLLTHPNLAAGTLTGKWENTKDLYAYYLLDVEMGACQLTSRLVQSSGSVQLFVQRCFMGIEPEVNVRGNGDNTDSAWRWWKWMRKYRVWEANKKVYMWPSNWIEPELKKDRSSYFKELEDELIQNEINQYTAETAYANYLEKLDGVAQLEIAGFYQEDDGDQTIIHVFGRTAGAEPHLYYYRRYDYRQWTPWEKVNLDVQGDYLIPAVINKRLFLFWPVFTEVPDEARNNSTKIPKAPGTTETSFTPEKAWKKLKLQMAVSEYQQGKWSPRKVSRDYVESGSYSDEIVRKHYHFWPLDRTAIDGRFFVSFGGGSLCNPNALCADIGMGSFEFAGCKGTPELTDEIREVFSPILHPEEDSVGHWSKPYFMKWRELGGQNEFGVPTPRGDVPENDFTLENKFALSEFSHGAVGSIGFSSVPILEQTPWIFSMSPAWHLSYPDKIMADGLHAIRLDDDWPFFRSRHRPPKPPMGSWLPFFYNDKKRTFFVLPQHAGRYYPEIKRELSSLDVLFAGQIQDGLVDVDVADLIDFIAMIFVPDATERAHVENFLYERFPGEIVPPFTDDYVRELTVRFIMRYVRYFLGLMSLNIFQVRHFHFKNFYHPFVCGFAKLLHNPLQGIPGLMKRETQLKNSGFSFRRSYRPTGWVVSDSAESTTLPNWAVTPGYPREVVDFSPDGAYSSYNWELFFHAPLLIANSLSKNQRFEEARDWYHLIFNPVGLESQAPGGSVMSKYWITKPFFETTDPQYVQQRIEKLLRMLSEERSEPGQPYTELEKQVLDWRRNPFEPHRIANYRTVAYQKTVVMKYLDNLISWGDYLFRQDSIESINEATQLYILAAEILGPRPKKTPPPAKPQVESFNELENQLDVFGNALVEVENLIPAPTGGEEYGPESEPLPMLYFCIPHNEKILEYWNTVADRLYKIRHCMNIEGVERQLSLFEPPIDPGALVKAAAAGIDIGSALADLNAPLPLYRFNVLLQKANEVCNDVKSLGAALLSALEKQDSEALGLLRQGQEIKLLDAVTVVREKQIEEANENLEGAKKSKELAEIRKKYYESREFMNAGEIVALALSNASVSIHIIGTVLDTLGGALSNIPNFQVGGSGFGGSPHATVVTGGSNISKGLELSARSLYGVSTILDKSASISSTVASYQRRQDDWDFQKDLAIKEIEQHEKTIAAMELRLAIAEKEKDNHIKQYENAKTIESFMQSKYTNEELYQWQIGQISGVYFQSYKLAYDLAKRAERSLRFELGFQDSNYIKFGYWNSLKKGLLSGEKLQYDLRRLESAYLEQNCREFELTKNVSLVQLDPLALIKLRETGRCFFQLPEELFDLDYPGHYFRRIKSVSVTLPCVTGPYTTISCTLRLLKNSIRVNTASGDNGYPRNIDDTGMPAEDTRFVENEIPVKAIAASSSQNDSGVFELNFRDERYLPFEGAGVISQWSLELFSDLPANNPDPREPDFGKPLRQFDYDTINDAVLHIKYTAREDVGVFKNGAVAHLREYFEQDGETRSLRMFNLRQEFPSQWHNFLHPTNPADGNVFELEMSPSLFVIRDQDKTLKINTVWMLARCTDTGSYNVVMNPPLPTTPPGLNIIKLTPIDQYRGLHFSQSDLSGLDIKVIPTATPVKWHLEMNRPRGDNLQEDPVKKKMEVEDILLVLGYEWY